MTQEEFLKEQGTSFHVRLLMLVHAQCADSIIKDDHTFHFEFPQGEYSISYDLLKQRADEEGKNMLIPKGPAPSNRR